MEALKGPRLVDHNGHTYRCEVDSTPASIIRLTNTETGDKWACTVTSSNIATFWTPPMPGKGVPMLAYMPHTAMGILQDVVEGAIPRGTYSNSSASASLVYKNSPYYFELKLTSKIDDSRGEWVFPMNPESAAAIEKRELAKLLQK